MSDDLRDHFPPPVRFATASDAIRHKNNLIISARVAWDSKSRECAVALFHQAGLLEEEFAKNAERQAIGVTEARALISAATCFGYSGDYERARRLFRECRRDMDADVKAFADHLARRRKHAGRLALQLKSAFESRDRSAVKRLCRQAVGLLPPSVVFWPQYRLAEGEGDYVAAADALRGLIVATPTRISFHLLYLVLLRDVAPEDALAYADRSLDSFLGDFRVRATRASIALRLDRVPDAVRDATDAIEKYEEGASAARSHLVMAYAVLAGALRRQNETKKALAVLDEAVKRLGPDTDLLTLRGLVLDQRGQQEDATMVLTEPAKDVRRGYWAQILMGRIDAKQERWGAARQSLEAAAERVPRVYEALVLNDLAVTLAHLGDTLRAQELLTRALARQPDLLVAKTNLRSIDDPRSTLLVPDELVRGMVESTSGGLRNVELAELPN